MTKAEKRLSVLAKEAMRELDAIHIPYSKKVFFKTSKATRRWGYCRRERDIYTISISNITLDDRITDENVKNTIIHELIHTCEGCMNHGENFKRYAAIVNDCYACYNIKRTGSYEEMGATEEVIAKYEKPSKTYIIGCMGCGRKYRYHKMTSLVRQLQANNNSETTYMCKCGCSRFSLF